MFKDRDFVSKHYLNDIILKIREYTKREATIMSTLVEFTQMVETEGTLEKNVKILSKMSNFSFSQQSGFHLGSLTSYNNDEYESGNEEISRKLLLTNLSNSEKIGVLIEYEDSSEDREEMLNKLSSDNSNDKNLFIKHNFIMIEPNGGYNEFGKPYSDSLFITVFVIGAETSDNTISITENENKEETDIVVNREIVDRFESKEDYLYFENDSLSRLVDFRYKCGQNSKHFLTQARVRGNHNNNNKCKECGNTAIGEYADYSFVCRKCKYQLCRKCCHKMVLTKHKNNIGGININKNIQAKNESNYKIGFKSISSNEDPNMNTLDSTNGNESTDTLTSMVVQIGAMSEDMARAMKQQQALEQQQKLMKRREMNNELGLPPVKNLVDRHNNVQPDAEAGINKNARKLKKSAFSMLKQISTSPTLTDDKSFSAMKQCQVSGDWFYFYFYFYFYFVLFKK